jgi:hypothetical protein
MFPSKPEESARDPNKLYSHADVSESFPYCTSVSCHLSPAREDTQRVALENFSPAHHEARGTSPQMSIDPTGGILQMLHKRPEKLNVAPRIKIINNKATRSKGKIISGYENIRVAGLIR